MFDALKKKLTNFRKKAAEDIPEEEAASEPEVTASEPAKARTPKYIVGDSGKRINPKVMDDLLWDLEIGLMEADVALPVVEEIKGSVREGLMGKRHDRKMGVDEVIESSLREAIGSVLRDSQFDFDAFIDATDKPVVVAFVGINGTGKTTALAKIAKRLLDRGGTVVISASDTFRAGAIEQICIHGEALGVKVIKHQAGSDPAAVAFDAVEHARARHRDVVLVDTAGRMQTNTNLIDEMKKIKRVVNPDLVIFVGDSLAGNDAIEQARAFNEAVGIDAVILTKIDADSKGGAALSIAYTIKKPIAFLSTGQEYDQLVKFDADWMVARLLD